MKSFEKCTANAVLAHPLKPFLPDGARLLLLGSFPPDAKRWSMPFYYPNFMNDMWRIWSVVFFGTPDAFIADGQKRYDCKKVTEFLSKYKIALGDTAKTAVRLNGTASDAHLEISEVADIGGMLEKIPDCCAVAATGTLAFKTLLKYFSENGKVLGDGKIPNIGGFAEAETPSGRKVELFRMPSSSRAFPMKFGDKVFHYKNLAARAGLLGCLP